MTWWWIPAAYALFLALLVYRYVTRRPRLIDWPPQTGGALVSVIVPARNEALFIENAIGGQKEFLVHMNQACRLEFHISGGVVQVAAFVLIEAYECVRPFFQLSLQPLGELGKQLL